MSERPNPSEPQPQVPTAALKPTERASGTVLARIMDAIKAIATVTEQLARLAKEDERTQGQVLELSRMVLSLSNQVSDFSGQMKGIEKRLEDKDRLIEATIKLRITEEVEKLKAEFRTCSARAER